MSNNRSITMTIWNHSPYTLTKFVGSSTAGSVPGPQGQSTPNSGATVNINVASGGALTVYASNGSGACDGTFTVSDANNHVAFRIDYTHPSNNNPTTCGVTPTTAYPSCMGVNDQPMPLSGHDPGLNIGLYVGDAVYSYPNGPYQTPVTAGYAAPLSSTPYSGNNARDVVNSMFQPAIRAEAVVQVMLDQYNAVPYQPADYSGAQLSLNAPNCPLGSANPKGMLTQTILNLWPGVVTDPVTTSPDYPLIQFLANFLVPDPAAASTPPLVMWVPKFIYNGTVTSGDTTAPAYQLLGYQAYPFAGTSTRFNLDNVKEFLQLLLGGAHFVNIQADRDFARCYPTTNVGRDLYSQFTTNFSDNNTDTGRHSCVGNSHYTNTINTSGWYYGNQMGEWAASGCGLLLSLLIAKTADNEYDTFMQLEGWPADNDWLPGQSGSIAGGERHGGDYEAYQKTLWNISTFGATPYSEKRATTIFLAPAPWTPTINSTTYMMPYVGAETLQGWLQTAFVSVPAGTP